MSHLTQWRGGYKINREAEQYSQNTLKTLAHRGRGRRKFCSRFHIAAIVKLVLRIRSPLDRAEILTAGSKLIALHSDRSDC